MSLHEHRREGGDSREHPPAPEGESASYLRAARFARTQEAVAAHVYAQAQAAIHRTPCDLSVYRVRRVTTIEIPV